MLTSVCVDLNSSVVSGSSKVVHKLSDGWGVVALCGWGLVTERFGGFSAAIVAQWQSTNSGVVCASLVGWSSINHWAPFTNSDSSQLVEDSKDTQNKAKVGLYADDIWLYTQKVWGKKTLIFIYMKTTWSRFWLTLLFNNTKVTKTRWA